MATLQLEDLSFTYRDQKNAREVLSALNITIRDGEFVCVLGASGCGKSTLLRLLAGLEKPTGGAVKINGVPVTGPGADRMIVFQDYSLFAWMTAKKNVQFAVRHAKKCSAAEADEIARGYLESVGLTEFADYYPYQLSGGMRQRVAIARALAMDTDILLMDEPFGALDAKIRGELQMLLEEIWLNKGGARKTIVFVTHDVNEAILLADRIIFMQPGRIIGEVAVDIPRSRMEHAYQPDFDRYRRQLMQMFVDTQEVLP